MTTIIVGILGASRILWDILNTPFVLIILAVFLVALGAHLIWQLVQAYNLPITQKALATEDDDYIQYVIDTEPGSPEKDSFLRQVYSRRMSKWEEQRAKCIESMAIASHNMLYSLSDDVYSDSQHGVMDAFHDIIKLGNAARNERLIMRISQDEEDGI